ncbi:MAG: N-acetylmuramoyl-L-alanine amidase [Alphaproteobacteria bacterium]|nr:N-acetylmuramoyl-L-alanine amidase [Alphaproteobacteria bacterium]
MMMKNIFKTYVYQMLSILAVVLICMFSSSANAAEIKDLRIGQGAANVRVVFDADSSFDYKVFLLNEPRRLVIDTQNISINPRVEKAQDPNNIISSVRLGSAGVDGIRVVFDLDKPVVVKKAFMLPPQSNFSWRFVVDLELVSGKEFASKLGNDHAFSNDSYNKGKTSVKNVSSSKASVKSSRQPKKIIVLDPGHGGVDPGAIGVSGTYEKHITLSMAKELKAELDKTGRYTVYLTRNRDVFIPLRQRVKIARRYDADLFLSIHADSAVNRRATGLSVYTLSERASDKEAAALAEKENKADIVAGLDFAEHSKEVSDVLLNLAQRETLNRSAEFATFMVQEMRKSTHTLDNTHRFAGFAVLKAPDVPSVLLELGYLSNRGEEKLLKQKSYRHKLAISATKAINKYFENMRNASVF